MAKCSYEIFNIGHTKAQNVIERAFAEMETKERYDLAQAMWLAIALFLKR